MKKTGIKNSINFILIISLFFAVWNGFAKTIDFAIFPLSPKTIEEDTSKTKKTEPLPYPFKDGSYDPTLQAPKSPLRGSENPSNVTNSVDYDPKTNEYNFNQKMGKLNYRNPSYMDFSEYMDYDLEKSLSKYWQTRKDAENIDKKTPEKGIIPKINVNNEAFDRIFGGNTVDIRPSGNAELIFGVNTNKTENPAIPVNLQKQSNFIFDQKIQLNVLGKIGDKLKLSTNYNTEASFDFENQMKMEYNGFEDEIIQKIEAGNVSLPLTGSLITGSQSLFGLKTQLRFGRATVTSVFSQQRGKKSEIELQGGSNAQTTKFEFSADNYEANRHYFLAQFFREQYDQTLANLPVVATNINITKVEVWVTNLSGAAEGRNIVGIADIGESFRGTALNQKPYSTLAEAPTTENSGVYPSNKGSNNLYEKIVNTLGTRTIAQAGTALSVYQLSHNFNLVQDYELLERARKLAPTEYTINPRLGFISLNQSLNNGEVLSVAYQYTVGEKIYQVGEFSTDGIADPKMLVVKMIKASNVRVKLPIWDLMMKNVYSIGGYNIGDKDFRLDVVHNNLQKGIDLNYIPEGAINGQVLIRVLNADQVNNQQERIPDGMYDLIEGVTIFKQNGRIFFPVIEPFGSHLRKKFGTTETNIADKYVFQELYDSTKIIAQQIPSKNRYKIKGQYSSASGAEIVLNAMNIPKGAVVVTAGGTPLTEDVDYTVDYNLGRVKILNEGVLASGQPIKISLESNSLFAIQTKRFWGSHLDYKISKDAQFGATIINLSERPLTQKVDIGSEPINNTVLGLDGTFKKDVPLLTKLVDFLPFYSTKETSSVQFQGEFAKLIPGNARAITKDGISYIDDFEGSQTSIDIRSWTNWSISSIPQGQPDMFPEASLTNDVRLGFNRAKLNWFVIDPIFQRNNNDSPKHLTALEKSNHFTREVIEQEVFPNKQVNNNIPNNIQILNLAYYPEEKGPYNYDVEPGPFSRGLNANGGLNNPTTRWGGIMRRIETTDFENANVEFIQFWMMDPFNEDNTNANSSGELYFNLGDMSEDILKDTRRSFENGIPANGVLSPELVDTTAWGIVPTVQSVVNAFDNDPKSRIIQDVGLDGLNSTQELTFYDTLFTQKISKYFTGPLLDSLKLDAANDDYHHFRGKDYDNVNLSVLDRYKKYNGLEGNSTVDQPDGYPISSTVLPNVEDINRDNNLTYSENYFQYKVKIDPSSMVVGQNFITDVVEGEARTIDGRTRVVKWYQFKVPIREPDKVVGDISDFRTIRFIRMFMRGFDKPIVCRFARLELIRGDWRRYTKSLQTPGEYLPDDEFDPTLFNVSAVNIEENGKRIPINYVVPNGIVREIDQTTTNLRQLNEQSLSLKVCNLKDGDSRAAFKNAGIDVRQYSTIQMYAHVEAGDINQALSKGDVNLFVRLGTDYDENYYEYEIPLTPTNFGETDATLIWPEDNNVKIEFQNLYDAKQQRNSKIASSEASLTRRYVYQKDKAIITIIGNPNLQNMKVIMIGVRNPKKKGVEDADDGLSKCAEVWVNELRLTDFNKEGGWAANARLSAKLADLGTVNVSATRITAGFGSVEQKLNERKRENSFSYDANGSFEMGKFLPKEVGIKVPMFVGYSESFINPQYNPLDPDIKYIDAVKNETPQKRDSLKEIIQDYTRRKSINFTNVKKEKSKNAKKSHFYDVENIALGYAYTETNRRNTALQYDNTRGYRGTVSYSFSNSPKALEPFKKSKSKFLKSPYLKIVKDINVNTSPSRFSFLNSLDRNYNEALIRNVSNPEFKIDPNYNKAFTWNRTYDFKYDLTKALNFDFTASNLARIDEAPGIMNKTDVDDYQFKKDSIIQNLKQGGRTTSYNHAANVSWNIPINKFPLTNWITSTAKYSANYSWQAAPPGADTSMVQQLGNSITNSNQKQINAQANLTQLYNKVPLLKNINNPKPPKPLPKKPVRPDLVKLKNDTAKFKIELKKYRIQKLAYDSAVKAQEDPYKFLKNVAKAIMGTKSVSINYTLNQGSLLPGYMPKTKILGMDGTDVWNDNLAPGQGFIFGQQNPDFPINAAQNGWLTQSAFLSTPFTQTKSEQLTGQATIEPVKDFKVSLNFSRNLATNSSSIYRYDATTGSYRKDSPLQTGNFSITVITIKTAFKKDAPQTFANDNFTKFINSRVDVSREMGRNNQFSTGIDSSGAFYDGYSATQQDVLITAFLSAYSSKPNDKSLIKNQFPKIPMPNWRVSYDGLSKLEAVKKYFKTVTLNHSYRSTFNIGAFTTNQLFIDDGGSSNDGFGSIRDINNSFRPNREIQVVSISEQFGPLAGVDMQWNNSLLTRLDFKRDRNLSMSLNTSQIMEIKGNEYVIGLGYQFKNVPMPLNKRLNTKIKSDLKLRCDLSIRKNTSLVRKIVEQSSQLTAGQTIITIKNTADYAISTKLTIRLFWDKIITKPLASLTFPTSNSNAGVSIRFTLAQ